MGEIEKYKNAEEFAAAHGEEVEVEDSTIGQMIKEMFIRDIEMAKWKFDYEVDPLGVWWRVPSEKERFQTEMYQKWARADEYDDIKKIKDNVTYVSPSNIFSYNNMKPDFGW